MAKKATKRNFNQILVNIQQQYEKADKDLKSEWVQWLNESLDELLHNDFFGTEGQLDPRGDNRDES